MLCYTTQFSTKRCYAMHIVPCRTMLYYTITDQIYQTISYYLSLHPVVLEYNTILRYAIAELTVLYYTMTCYAIYFLYYAILCCTIMLRYTRIVLYLVIVHHIWICSPNNSLQCALAFTVHTSYLSQSWLPSIMITNTHNG